MNHLHFRPSSRRSGFLESFIAPVDQSENTTFGPLQAIGFVALVVVTLSLARLLLV